MSWPLLVCMLTVILWPNIALWKERELTEADLIAISPKYQGIGRKLRRHLIGEALILMLVPASVIFGPNMSASQRAVFAAPIIAVTLSAIGWADAWFACNLGVYPSAKYHGPRTRYTYSSSNKVRSIAKYQLGVTSLTVAVAAIWVVVMTYW